MAALLLVPLLGLAGLALDASRAMRLHGHLMRVADATALGAISEGSPGSVALKAIKQDGTVSVAEDDAKQIFMSQRGLGGENVAAMPLTVDVRVARSNGTVTSQVDFAVEMPTTFLQIVGIRTVAVTGTAKAVYGAEKETYTDFYLLLDNTPSMGIAATTKDIAKFQALTKGNGQRGCEFACHLGRTNPNGTFIENGNSSYLTARANGITLRIDVVVKAAEALIERVKTEMANSADKYKVAAYTFGSAALENGYRIERVLTATMDMQSASNTVRKVALQTTDHDHFHDNALTSFDVALTDIGKEIAGVGGEGQSPSDPYKVVYFVTDGVADSMKSGSVCGGSWFESRGRCLEPIDVRYCTALKARNIKIAVLYTTYIPPSGDHIWETYMKQQFGARIATNLKACASDDLYFEVGPDDSMEQAMSHLFLKAANSFRNLRLAM